jgi:hypothetical protein
LGGSEISLLITLYLTPGHLVPISVIRMDSKWMKKNQMMAMRGRRSNKIRTKREKTEDVDEKRRQLGGEVGEEIRRCEKQKNIMMRNEKAKQRKTQKIRKEAVIIIFFLHTHVFLRSQDMDIWRCFVYVVMKIWT